MIALVVFRILAPVLVSLAIRLARVAMRFRSPPRNPRPGELS